MAHAVLDAKSGQLRYANAAHPFPILVRRNGPPQQLSGCGLPIGVLDGEQYDDASVQLEPGDRVYFYSDGMTEAFNEQDKMLETDGLIQLIERTRSRPLSEAVAACVEELKRWCGPVPLRDDLSLLVLELPEAE
jgi:phosphoserine phosphatase RsbU/P